MSDAMDVKLDTAKLAADLRRRMQKLLAVGVAVAETAKEAELRLKELTPRDDDHGGEHTADLWETSIKLGGANSGGPQRDASGRFLKKGTGATAEAIIDHPFNTPGAVHPQSGKVMNDGTHNLIATIEYGSQPHEIRAKNVPLLRFKVLGKWVAVKSVWHPGTRPHAMIRTTRAETAVLFKRRLQELLK